MEAVHHGHQGAPVRNSMERVDPRGSLDAAMGGGHADGHDLLGESIAQEAEDRRGARRFTMLIRSAKLVIGGKEFLCVIKDVSEDGVSLRVFHPLPAGGAVELELGNGDRYPLEFVREGEGLAAFRFSKDVDLPRLIEEPNTFRKRPARLSVMLPGTVTGIFGSEMVYITNISQQGARLECERRFAQHQRLKLAAKGLPEIAAKVRWCRNSECGIVFESTFRFEEFARLAAAIQG